MFNLTRHSHHHAQGEVPYQDRKPFPNAPMMINGYLTTPIVALIPPQMAAHANARSGIPLLWRASGATGTPAAGMASNGL